MDDEPAASALRRHWQLQALSEVVLLLLLLLHPCEVRLQMAVAPVADIRATAWASSDSAAVCSLVFGVCRVKAS